MLEKVLIILVFLATFQITPSSTNGNDVNEQLFQKAQKILSSPQAGETGVISEVVIGLDYHVKPAFDLMTLLRANAKGELSANELQEMNIALEKIIKTVNLFQKEYLNGKPYSYRTWAVLELALLEYYEYSSKLNIGWTEEIKKTIQATFPKGDYWNTDDTSGTSLWLAFIYKARELNVLSAPDEEQQLFNNIIDFYDSVWESFRTKSYLHIGSTSNQDHLLILWGLSIISKDEYYKEILLENNIDLNKLLLQQSLSFSIEGLDHGRATLGLLTLISKNLDSPLQVSYNIKKVMLRVSEIPFTDALSQKIFLTGLFAGGNFHIVEKYDDERFFSFEKPLPTTKELSLQYGDAWKANPEQAMVDLINNISPYVEQTSSEGDTETFRNEWRGACRTLVNYLVETLQILGTDVTSSTLFGFPTEQEAHSFLTIYLPDRKLFVFADTGLVVSDDGNKMRYQEIDAAKYNKRFQLMNKMIMERINKNQFDWIPNRFDENSYETSYFPVHLSFHERVEKIEIGKKQLLPSHDSWEDMASTGNLMTTFTNHESSQGYVANLFVLGSMNFPYQPQLFLDDLSSPVEIEIVFSFVTETLFEVKALPLGASIIGDDTFKVKYGSNNFPSNEKEASWKFKFLPNEESVNPSLILTCPTVKGDGQKLFIDSITIKKVNE